MLPLPIGLSSRQPQALEALYPVVRGLCTLFIAALGTTLFGMVGSLAYPAGEGTAFASLLGLFISLTVGGLITGFWRDLLPGDGRTFGLGSLVPHSVAVKLGSHGKFDLILTVHEAVGVRVQGHMPWRRADLYVEIECGSNPPKRTCVKANNKFNEQFKLEVNSGDEGILLRIKDQDIFGASNVGYVYVDIQDDIINAGFPLQKEFVVEAGESDWLRWSEKKAHLILSFDYTEEYPSSAVSDAASRSRAKRDFRSHLSSRGYGAVSFLTQLEFNRHERIERTLEAPPPTGPSDPAEARDS